MLPDTGVIRVTLQLTGHAIGFFQNSFEVLQNGR